MAFVDSEISSHKPVKTKDPVAIFWRTVLSSTGMVFFYLQSPVGVSTVYRHVHLRIRTPNVVSR